MAYNLQNPYPAVYKNDRRDHKHRCRCCWKIVTEGENVLFLRLNKKTWCIHDACGEKEHSPGTSWREVFTLWAKERFNR